MRLRVLIIGAVVIAVALVGVLVVISRFGGELPTAVGRACEARTSSGSVTLKPDQMANAATIAAVGIRRKLPDRAIVVALATALQESKLENVTHGDRDSVGLFQQRPSQGWGTAQQIQDPRYAAKKFYQALVRVKGWEEMRVTDAAQRVQRSAFPEAYQRWSDKATVLAEALAGRATSAVSCTRVGTPTQRGEAAAVALNAGLRLDWGDVTAAASSQVLGVVVTATTVRTGWQYAHWIVAHSSGTGVERVRYGGQEWSADTGQWQSVDNVDNVDGGADRVVAQVYGS